MAWWLSELLGSGRHLVGSGLARSRQAMLCRQAAWAISRRAGGRAGGRRRRRRRRAAVVWFGVGSGRPV